MGRFAKSLEEDMATQLRTMPFGGGHPSDKVWSEIKTLEDVQDAVDHFRRGVNGAFSKNAFEYDCDDIEMLFDRLNKHLRDPTNIEHAKSKGIDAPLPMLAYCMILALGGN